MARCICNAQVDSLPEDDEVEASPSAIEKLDFRQDSLDLAYLHLPPDLDEDVLDIILLRKDNDNGYRPTEVKLNFLFLFIFPP